MNQATLMELAVTLAPTVEVPTGPGTDIKYGVPT